MKKPNVVIYWADSKTPLTHAELVSLFGCAVCSAVPSDGILIRSRNGRHVMVKGLDAEGAPKPPPPKVIEFMDVDGNVVLRSSYS